MKQTFLAFVLSLVVFAGCTNSTPAEKTVEAYTPEKTEPMELVTFETITLQQPNTESGDALMKTIQNRKSNRDFQNHNNLSIKHLSEILWVANGINRTEDNKRTVPSAMALYPLDLYVFLSNGVYFYNVEKHELVPMVEGDHRILSGLQPFTIDAPANLVFIANYNRYNGDRKVPEDKRLYLAALDAGHCTQNVYLYCASEGLKTVVRAGAQEKEIMELLNLDENHQFVVAQTIGY